MTLGVAGNRAPPAGGPAFAPTSPAQVGATAVACRPFGLFRMTLALMVMMHHFGIHLASVEASLVFRRLDLGRVAVLAFFILSGFVINEAAETFYDRRPVAFACNRLLRIMPPFFGAIILSYVVQLGLFEAGWLHPLEGERVNASDFTPLALIMNLLAIMPGARLLGELPDYLLIRYVWAVRVEVLFYLIVTASLAGSFVAGRRRNSGPAALLAIMGVLGCLASVTGRAGGAFEYAPYFALGSSSFYFLRASPGQRLIHGTVVGLALLASATHFCFISGAGIAAPTEILALCIAIAAWLSNVATMPRWLGRIDRRVGALTYPLYLNHFLIGTVVASLWPSPGTARLVVASSLAIALAALMDRTVEPLTRHARNRLRREKLDAL